MRLIYFTLLYLLSQNLWGQLNGPEAQQNIDFLGGGSGNLVRVFDGRDRNVVGTPYLNDDWLSGSVITTQGAMIEGVFVLYDLVDETLYVKKENREFVVLQDRIASFSVVEKNQRRIFRPFTDADGKFFFGEIVAAGNMELIRHLGKYFIPASQQSSAYNTQMQAEYKSKKAEWYLFHTQDKRLIPVKLSKSSLLAALDIKDGVLAEKVAGFIKQEKLLLKEEEDAEKLMEFYNSNCCK